LVLRLWGYTTYDKYKESSPNQFVLLGDDNKLAIVSYGHIILRVFNSEKKLVKNVLHISSLGKNLFSMRKIIQAG
jgi:hypothetical protein